VSHGRYSSNARVPLCRPSQTPLIIARRNVVTGTTVANYLTSFDAVVFSITLDAVITLPLHAQLTTVNGRQDDTEMDGRARFDNKGPHVDVVPPSERQQY